MNVRTFTAGSFAENAYLVSWAGSDAAVIVDPGAGAPELMEAVHENGLQVSAILLTHSHLDHVEGVPEVLDGLEAPVPIHLHPDARELYDALPEQADGFGVELDDLPEPDRELEHGQVLELGESAFEVRHAPGHAPGHVIFWAEAEDLAFVGDVVFRGSIGRTDLPGGDLELLMSSIREQVLTLPDSTRLLTGHGPETTVEQERTGNPFLVPNYGGELA